VAIELISNESDTLAVGSGKSGAITQFPQFSNLVNNLPVGVTPSFVGSVPISLRMSTATTSTTWLLANYSTTAKIYITNINLTAFFDGTAAATDAKWVVNKVTNCRGATGTGGVAPIPFAKYTSKNAPIAQSINLDAGIGLTSVGPIAITTTPLFTLIAGRVLQTTTLFQYQSFVWSSEESPSKAIELGRNELLTISTGVVSVIGDNLIGTVQYYEA
jgi:hypothetical protein